MTTMGPPDPPPPPPPPPHVPRPFYRSKRWWVIGAVVVVTIIAVATRGADTSSASAFCDELDTKFDVPAQQGGIPAAVGEVDAGRVTNSAPYDLAKIKLAAPNARALAADAPSDVKTDMTNIAKTLSAAAAGNYSSYSGDGNEVIRVRQWESAHCPSG
jgi:hypothetical protein